MEELPLCFEEECKKRPVCVKCNLHPNICICKLIPEEKGYDNHPCFVILQDPREAKAKLNTVKLIERYFKNVLVYKKHMPIEFIEMIQQNPGQFVILFPRKNAHVIDDGSDISFTNKYKYIIIIDGTWDQAKSIYNRNEQLHQLETLILEKGNEYSQYRGVRKEVDGGMSTFEAAITTISILNNQPTLLNDRDSIMKEFIEMRKKYVE